MVGIFALAVANAMTCLTPLDQLGAQKAKRLEVHSL